MREQGNSAWGLTVSRRFDTPAEATGAAENLRQAGFREDEIRVWQHKRSAVGAGEDRLARTFEALLAGGVIGGLAGFFFTIAITWAGSERTAMETGAAGALIGAVGGAILVALAATVASRKYSFGHHGEGHHDPASVVTVTVGDRESEAKQVFDKLGG